jgi:hypothetical protein
VGKVEVRVMRRRAVIVIERMTESHFLLKFSEKIAGMRLNGCIPMYVDREILMM